ncbi:MAG TPA: PPC domain-containing protein [Rubricoccaceae bacterium]|nr:PPC domain-containing protein [Rubricoccaceae bacterium]
MRKLLTVLLLLAALPVAGCDSPGDDDDNGITNAQLEALADVFSCDVEAIRLNGDESGSLSTSDCENPADQSFIDYYGFRLTESTEVDIRLSSDEFDTYLFLYDEDGNVIEFHDDIDFPDNTNSRITRTLEAGVYAIGANSFDEGETGSYTLELDEN